MMNDLPPNWVLAPIEDFCDVVMGQSPNSSSYNSIGRGLPFFQGKAEFGDIHPLPVKWCTAPGKQADRTSVLLSVRAPVGPTNLSPGECIIGRGLAAISPHGGIRPHFLLYNIRTFINNLKQQSTGSTFDAVSGLQVRRFLLPIPPLKEQHHIVAKVEELFSNLDAGVASLERAKAKLTRYRAALLKAAVEGKLTEKWRQQNPATETGEELLQRILWERRRQWEKDQLAAFKAKGQTPPKNWQAKYKEPSAPDTKGLPSLPQGWCWASLGQLAYIQGGIQKQPSRKPQHNIFPFLRVANVLRNHIITQKMHEIELFEGELERLSLKKNDLLIVEGNGSQNEIGRSALWDDSVKNCVHQNHIIRARLVYFSPKFCNYYWNSTNGIKSILSRAASTSGLYTLSVQKVAQIPIPVPSLIEQSEIAQILDSATSSNKEQVSSILKAMVRATRLRQAILKKAFEGNLVPQDPNDEPASVLLERIRRERESAMPIPAKRKAQKRISNE